MGKVYWVCDARKIPEMGCDIILYYLKKIDSSELAEKKTLRKKIRRTYDEWFEQNKPGNHYWDTQEYKDLWTNKIYPLMNALQQGEFGGIYELVPDGKPQVELDETFEHVPSRLSDITDKLGKTIGQQTIEDYIKEFAWDIKNNTIKVPSF